MEKFLLTKTEYSWLLMLAQILTKSMGPNRNIKIKKKIMFDKKWIWLLFPYTWSYNCPVQMSTNKKFFSYIFSEILVHVHFDAQAFISRIGLCEWIVSSNENSELKEKWQNTTQKKKSLSTLPSFPLPSIHRLIQRWKREQE